MRNFIDSLKARREAAKNEGGFSLIDVVVTVAIIVALSVGGFVAYTGLIDNAKKAAVAGAADQVYTAIVVAENDTDAATTGATVKAAYEKSTADITITVTGTGNTLSVKATNKDTPAITATRGAVTTP